MSLILRDAVKNRFFAFSRRIHFRGKARLLDLVKLGLRNRELVPDGVDTVDCINGIRIATSCCKDIMFRELYMHGVYQDEVLVAVRNLLRPGGVFWDIGANYGLMSIGVDKWFDGTVRTIAFEPNPIVLKDLYRNIRINDCRSIFVQEVCLSDRVGDVTFYCSENHSWNATLIEKFAQINNENIKIKVQSSTIDEAVETLGAPSVIKLDVEGAEHLVVEGGKRFLHQAQVPIIAEYNVIALRASGIEPTAYLGMFGALGYEPHVLKRPLYGFHRWRSLRKVGSASELPTLCNVIFLKRSTFGGRR